MKIKGIKKITAGILSSVMLCSSLPCVFAEDSNVIFSSGFENGEGVSSFTGRGGVEVIEATTEYAKSGSYSMCVSGREKSWNGPQFRIDEICEPNTEYIVNASAKAQYYGSINLSMEYTDETGTRHYNVLGTLQGSDWLDFENYKVSFTSDMTNVYVYFESGNTENIYIDDFSITKAADVEVEDIPSLKEVYSNYFDIGTAIGTSTVASQPLKDLIDKHFELITPGNELKPESLLDREACIAAGNDNPQISLANARTVLNYCRDNNIPVRGHTLVWHSQTPDWFFKENYADDGDYVSKETMLLRMENYIKNVMEALATEYPTVEFYAWDVVNEAWLDDGSVRQPGGYNIDSNTSGWVKVFGDNSFIEPAFEYARKYAPEGCKLYYNDYNEYIDGKTNAIYNMAMDLKEKGLIDGIGMQSHLDVGYPSVSQYRKALEKFASTGLDIQVTELDITTTGNTDADFEKQAEIYNGILEACVEFSDSISAVIFWGITDDGSWRAPKYPLLFDAEYKAKPSYYAIIDNLDAPVSTTTTTSTPSTTTSTTTTTTIVTESTTSEAPGPLVTVAGDANLDGQVDIADAVAVAAYVGDPTSNTLTDQGLINADVHSTGNGINSSDALTIQQYLSGIIDTL